MSLLVGMFIRKVVCTASLALMAVGAYPLSLAEAQELALLDNGETIYRKFTAEPRIPKQGPIVLVIEQELQEFLELAGKLNGYEVTFSSAVSGTLKDATFPMDMKKLLPALGQQFNLKWHIQSKRLFVSDGALRSQRILPLDGVNLEDLKFAIGNTGIKSANLEVTNLDNEDAVLVSGPPSYLDAIFEIVQDLKKIEKPNE